MGKGRDGERKVGTNRKRCVSKSVWNPNSTELEVKEPT